MASIVFLSDEVLVEILSWLRAIDLVNVSQVNIRLSRLAKDKSLVKHLDLSREIELSPSNLKKFLDKEVSSKIVNLQLNSLYWFTAQQLRFLSRCSSLKSLGIADTKLSLADIYTIIKDMPDLENLSFTIQEKEAKCPTSILRKSPELVHVLVQRPLLHFSVEYRDSPDLYWYARRIQDTEDHWFNIVQRLLLGKVCKYASTGKSMSALTSLVDRNFQRVLDVSVETLDALKHHSRLDVQSLSAPTVANEFSVENNGSITQRPEMFLQSVLHVPYTHLTVFRISIANLFTPVDAGEHFKHFVEQTCNTLKHVQIGEVNNNNNDEKFLKSLDPAGKKSSSILSSLLVLHKLQTLVLSHVRIHVGYLSSLLQTLSSLDTLFLQVPSYGSYQLIPQDLAKGLGKSNLKRLRFGMRDWMVRDRALFEGIASTSRLEYCALIDSSSACISKFEVKKAARLIEKCPQLQFFWLETPALTLVDVRLLKKFVKEKMKAAYFVGVVGNTKKKILDMHQPPLCHRMFLNGQFHPISNQYHHTYVQKVPECS